MNDREPAHFTYKAFLPDNDLYQGDILEPTVSLRSVLAAVHPHFLEDKYTGFLVLTQTCDLDRRMGALCKSRYINLAVIRPLEEVLCNFLDKVCERVRIAGKPVSRFYVRKSKQKAYDLLERIVNQNEQSLGVFYLHPDGVVGIAEDSVALLRVSIALRAEEHYDKLIDARRGRLADPFRDKLGWLVGNLFSRVATNDLPKIKQKSISKKFLNHQPGSDYAPCWVVSEKVELANKGNLNIDGLPRTEIAEKLQQYQIKQPKAIAIEQVLRVVKGVVDPLSEKHKRLIAARLNQDPVFTNICK